MAQLRSALHSADVTFNVSSVDITEALVQGGDQPSPAATLTITFSEANWSTPQQVTVVGQDDSINDGNQIITIATAAAASTNTDYNGFNPPPDVSATVSDNDVAGITILPLSGLVTSEAGATDSFSVVLNTEPTANVTIGLSSSDTTEVLVQGGDSPGVAVPAITLTFTNLDWNTPQTVTLVGQDDGGLDDGDQLVTIATGDPFSAGSLAYNALTAGNVADVTVTNIDDDAPAMTVTPTSGLFTSESGAIATFTVALNTIPDGDVVLDVVSTDLSEVSADKSQLTFTTVDWLTPKTVTVSGLADLTVDGNQTMMVSLQVNAVGTLDTTGYQSVNPPDVTIVNIDSDVAGVTLNPATGLFASEGGGTTSFTVQLNTQPVGGAVEILVLSGDAGEVIVDQASLTFTSADWFTPQVVTLTGVDDGAVTNLDNEAAPQGTAGSPLDLSAALPYSGSVDSGISFYVVSGLVPGADYYVSINSLTDDLALSVFEDAFITLSCGPEDSYADARPESCTAAAIPTDTLYIAIDGVNAAAGATFTVDVIPAPVAEGAIGAPLDITAALPGYFGGVDSGNSYYKVTGLTPGQNYLVQLSALTDNVDLRVYDSAGFTTQLCASNNSTIAEGCEATSNGLGELYIRVSTPGPVSAATFTLDVTAPLVDEGSPASPVDITGLLPYPGQVLTADPAGSYYVIGGLIPGSPYTINLNDMSGFAGLEVYDDLFSNLVCAANNPGNLPENCSTGVFANGSGKIYVHAACNTGICQADGATFTIQSQ